MRPARIRLTYAAAVVVLTGNPQSVVDGSREFLCSTGEIPSGQTPVLVDVRAFKDGPAAGLLAQKIVGDRILVSGDVLLMEGSSQPVITAFVCCPATDEQYLNEVTLVGRIGSEPKPAGKSTRRSVALNRYLPNPQGGDPIEQTDWYGCRVFGTTQERFSRVDIGALVEVSGSFSQMTSSANEPYCEVKVRSFRVHRGRGGSSDPATGTAAVGYDQASFEVNHDIHPNWN